MNSRGESLAGHACLSVSGSGTVTVELHVSTSPEYSTSGLALYYLAW